MYYFNVCTYSGKAVEGSHYFMSWSPAVLWEHFFFLFPDKSNTPEFCDCSCSATNTARSSFQQYQQLPLYTKTQTSEEIMKEILTNHAHPCKACTNITFAHSFFPENHEYDIDLAALNGWIFQNHFDCVASAIVGGIHAVLGFTRGNPAFNTRDIIRVMEIMHSHRATIYLNQMKEKYPEEDWEAIKNVLIVQQCFVSGAQAEANTDLGGSINFYNKLLEEVMIVSSKDILSSHLSRELYQLSLLRELNVCTSFQSPIDVIHTMNLGLTVSKIQNYTFEELRDYVTNENTSVLVDLPAHLGLVFGVGKERESGNYPHVLLSRPSGGQSPSGWVPWTLKDRMPGETLWEDDIEPDPSGIQEAIRTGALSEDVVRKLVHSDTGISMELEPGRLRTIFIIEKTSTVDQVLAEEKTLPLRYNSCFDDVVPLKCKTCCNTTVSEDSLRFEEERKIYLNK